MSTASLLGNTTIAPLAVPPETPVAIYDCPWLGGNGDIGTSSGDHVVVEQNPIKIRRASKGHDSPGQKLGKIECRVSWDSNAVESDGCTRRGSRWNGSICSDMANVWRGRRRYCWIGVGRSNQAHGGQQAWTGCDEGLLVDWQAITYVHNLLVDLML